VQFMFAATAGAVLWIGLRRTAGSSSLSQPFQAVVPWSSLHGSPLSISSLFLVPVWLSVHVSTAIIGECIAHDRTSPEHEELMKSLCLCLPGSVMEGSRQFLIRLRQQPTNPTADGRELKHLAFILSEEGLLPPDASARLTMAARWAFQKGVSFLTVYDMNGWIHEDHENFVRLVARVVQEDGRRKTTVLMDGRLYCTLNVTRHNGIHFNGLHSRTDLNEFATSASDPTEYPEGTRSVSGDSPSEIVLHLCGREAGRWGVVQAVRAICRSIQEGETQPEQITHTSLEAAILSWPSGITIGGESDEASTPVVNERAACTNGTPQTVALAASLKSMPEPEMAITFGVEGVHADFMP